MDISALFFTMAILILVGMYLYAPFIHKKTRRIAEDSHDLSALMAERDRVLSSLQELDFDFNLGKVPEEDYPPQRTNLLQKGADILRRIDEMTGGEASAIGEAKKKSAGKEIADVELEALISARRQTRKVAFDGFCPKCGKPVMSTDRFCPACGNALH